MADTPRQVRPVRPPSVHAEVRVHVIQIIQISFYLSIHKSIIEFVPWQHCPLVITSARSEEGNVGPGRRRCWCRGGTAGGDGRRQGGGGRQWAGQDGVAGRHQEAEVDGQSSLRDWQSGRGRHPGLGVSGPPGGGDSHEVHPPPAVTRLAQLQPGGDLRVSGERRDDQLGGAGGKQPAQQAGDTQETHNGVSQGDL